MEYRGLLFPWWSFRFQPETLFGQFAENHVPHTKNIIFCEVSSMCSTLKIRIDFEICSLYLNVSPTKSRRHCSH